MVERRRCLTIEVKGDIVFQKTYLRPCIWNELDVETLFSLLRCLQISYPLGFSKLLRSRVYVSVSL